MSRQTQNTKRYNVFIFFIQRGNTNRMNRILPPCEYTVSTDLQRLSTFSKLTDQDVTHKISAVRLAASGCVYNADEGYIECTGCAKVSMLNNGIITTLDNNFNNFIRNKMYGKRLMKLCSHIRLFDLSFCIPVIHFQLLVPQLNSVNDIKTYHQKPCLLVLEYIEKQEKEIREGMINLHELKRFHRRSHENGWYTSSYELFQCKMIINCETLRDINVHCK